MKPRLAAAVAAFSTILAWGALRHHDQPTWQSDAAVLISEPAPEPSPRQLVAERASRNGWNTGRQWACLVELVHRESRWNPNADNPKSSAQGLFQILKQRPGLPVTRQAELGIRYITHRYGTPCHALAFHNDNGYY